MPISDAELRRCLNALRERYLVPKYPSTRREEGLLRRAMIDYLVEARPPSGPAFLATAPEWLIAETSTEQLEAELESVIAALNEFCRGFELPKDPPPSTLN